MKGKNKGITLVALVITVIILLILAGITINLTIGENGIIQKAKEAGRNYQNAAEYEKIALDELMNTTDHIIDNVTNDNKKPYDESEFRKLIAQAITQEGVATTWEDSNVIFVENIGKILQERTKDATATEDDIVVGKTAYVNGERIEGKLDRRNLKSEVSYVYSATTNGYEQLYAKKGGILQDMGLMTYDEQGNFTANKDIEVIIWCLGSSNNGNENYHKYVVINGTTVINAGNGGWSLFEPIYMNKGDIMNIYCQQGYPVDYHNVQAYLVINEM